MHSLLHRPSQSRRSLRSILPVLMAAGVVSLNLSACGLGKTAQCNSLSKEINKVSGLGKKFEAVGKDLESKGKSVKGIEDFHKMSKEGATSVKGLVTELDGFTTQVKSVDLQDEKLVGYRDRAVSIYTGASKSLKEVGSVLDDFTKLQANEEGKKMLETSMKKLNAAMADLKKVDEAEQAVAKEFNTYCGVEKKG